VAITLSDIDEEGVLTVHVHGPGLDRLQELMTRINDKFQVRSIEGRTGSLRRGGDSIVEVGRG